MMYILVLGIDPGWTMGIAAIDTDRDLVQTWLLDANAKDERKRYDQVADFLVVVFDEAQPDVVVIELPFGKFRQLRMGEVLGLIKACVFWSSLADEVVEMTTAHAKKVLLGNGRAKMEEAREWVRRAYDVDSGISEHELDALAAAAAYLKREEIE